VALSADQLVLACVAHNVVYFYSLPQLLGNSDAVSPQPLACHTLDAGVVQFRWAKDEAHTPAYLAVSDESALLIGQFPGSPATVANGIRDADWAPVGLGVATVGDDTTLTLWDNADWGSAVHKMTLSHDAGVCERRSCRSGTAHVLRALSVSAVCDPDP
jgi:hypothetical protein